MYKANEKTIHGSGIPPEPDAKVQKTEDAFMKQSSGIQALGNLSLAKDFFPARPAHGTKGNHVTVWANFFEVGFDPNMLYFRYSVDVKPEGKAPKASKSKIQRLLILLLELEDFRGALTDFRSNLYSRTQLKNVPGDTLISFRAQGEDVPPTIPARYRILIQETGTVLVSQYQNSLSSTNFNDPQFVQRNEVLQALNTNLGHYAQLRHDLVTLGQNKHYPIDPPDNADLGKWLQALRGFYISFRPATSRILLNVNVSHTVCFAPLRLDYLLRELGGKDHLGRLARKLKLLRLQRLHLLGRKNKAGKVIPSVAVFLDFATPNDGTTEANPPQVRAYGAGPKDVKFFLTGEQPVSKGLSGKKTGKAAGPGSGKYISVWDYFSTSKLYVHVNYDINTVG
jgi:eukaryotic translation initiation factor 2C